MQPKRVFLSYAWESDEFRTWVKALATRLREDGVEARLDDWHLPKNGNIPEFMNREVREADWVLVLCSPGYQQRVRATEDGERVSGVGWESRLLSGGLLVTNQNKILAVLAQGQWQHAAPDSLLGQIYFDISHPATFEENYEGLVRAITGTTEKAPPLGAPHPAIAEEPVGALRYHPAQQPHPPGSAASTGEATWARRIAGHAPAILAVTIALDLLLAWFVRAQLPFASVTFAGLCLSLSPFALLFALSLTWAAIFIRSWRRPAKV